MAKAQDPEALALNLGIKVEDIESAECNFDGTITIVVREGDFGEPRTYTRIIDDIFDMCPSEPIALPADRTPEPSPRIFPSSTPSASSKPVPTPSVTPSMTPSISASPTPLPISPTLPTPTPSASLPPQPTPSASAVVIIDPTPTPRPVQVGDALLISTNELDYEYVRGSKQIPTSKTINLTNLFSDSTLTVNISNQYVSPNTISLGPNETKTVTVLIGDVQYLESLPFGDSSFQFLINVSRTLLPLPPEPEQIPTPIVTPTPEIVMGCMSQSAKNFNPRATQDDGSCIFSESGCRDPQATTFNPNADISVAEDCKYTLQIQKVTGDNQISNSGLFSPAPMIARVVMITADTNVAIPLPRINVLVQSDGQNSYASRVGSYTAISAINSDEAGQVTVELKGDSQQAITQLRLSIDASTLDSKYIIDVPSVTFSMQRNAPVTSSTPPTTSSTPSTGTTSPTTPVDYRIVFDGKINSVGQLTANEVITAKLASNSFDPSFGQILSTQWTVKNQKGVSLPLIDNTKDKCSFMAGASTLITFSPIVIEDYNVTALVRYRTSPTTEAVLSIISKVTASAGLE